MTRQEIETKLANFKKAQDDAKVEFERAKATLLRLEGAVWVLEELLEETAEQPPAEGQGE